MKQLLFLALIVFSSCETKQTSDSANTKIENYLSGILGKKVTSTIYIVHPNVCGACSNEFLIALAKGRVSKRYCLLATGPFKKENQQYADQIKSKLHFVDAKKMGRLGLSGTVPYVLKLVNGKIVSTEILEIGQY